MALTLTALPDIPLIKPGDHLVTIMLHALASAGIYLEDGDILVVAQKVVSKAEGRMVDLSQIRPSQRALEYSQISGKDPRLVEMILRESKQVLRASPGTLIVEHRLGFVCANAGIDHSNTVESGDQSEDCVLLLPENPDASASVLRAGLEKTYGVRLGVMIIDSHGRAWRLGTVGTTIGLSGLPGLVDLRGRPDLFGFRLRITQVGAADELAAAASLIMGQAAEGTPVVHVRGFPYPLREAKLGELLRPEEQDLFR
ncbi:MAG TPA: coenzyme F420-0:L-glutamate ligase [Anaerolineales bacterium]|nr:coenzyme F420-0:L-glutamate ligase [Anaerolineales bacterium]